MADLQANIRIRAIDQFSRVMGKVRGAIDGVTKAQERAAKHFAMAANMNQASAAVGRFGAVSRKAIAAPLKVAADFEQAMAKVKSVTQDVTENEFQQMITRAREMGVKTKFHSTEAAEGMYYLAIAGFDARQQMQAIEPVLNLATAATVDLGRASDIASDIMGAFKLDASEMDDVANVLTATFTRSNTTLESLFETMKMTGSTAKTLGLDLRTTSAMAGLLGSAGIKGTNAGTAMRQMFNKFAKQTPKAKRALDELNLSFKDSKGELIPLPKLFGDVVAATEKLPKLERLAKITTIFGPRAANAVLNLMEDARFTGDEGASKLTKFITGLTDVADVTKQIADIRMNTTVGSVQELGSAIEDLQITIGDVANKDLADLVRGLTETIRNVGKWTREHPGLTKAIFYTGAAIAAFLTVLQTAFTAMATFYGIKGLAALSAGFEFGLIPAAKGAIVALGRYAATAWAAIAPTLAAAAPFLAVAAAIITVTLAVRQLHKYWSELDFGKAFEGIATSFSEEGVFSTLGQIFDPTAALDSIKEDISSTGDAVAGLFRGGQPQPGAPNLLAAGAARPSPIAPGQPTQTNVGGAITIDVKGAPATVSTKSTGPVDIVPAPGLAMARTAG